MDIDESDPSENLTEFNTAHNRRISMLGIGDEPETPTGSRKKRRRCVTFSEEHELINPEDVDPSVGRFRNMVHTTVIPGKRQRIDGLGTETLSEKSVNPKHLHPTATHSLYNDLPHAQGSENDRTNSTIWWSAASRLGISFPDPAPEVGDDEDNVSSTGMGLMPSGVLSAKQQLGGNAAGAVSSSTAIDISSSTGDQTTTNVGPSKKIYAKEAWPGKKGFPPLLTASSTPYL